MPSITPTPPVFSLKVPPVFGGHCLSVERFWAKVESHDISDAPIALDLSDVSHLCPYDVLTLVLAGRRLIGRGTALPILLHGFQPNVYEYLERVDLFSLVLDELSDWPIFQAKKPLVKPWNRNSASQNLLEITRLHCEMAVQDVERRVSQIFRAHLGENTGHIVNVVSELCRNAHGHSQDAGFVVVQKTNGPPCADGSPQACLRVAVCDLGVGVHASLLQRHIHLQTPTAALQGVFRDQLSANERGGNGLFTVASRVGPYSGSVWMRSDNAAMECLPCLPEVKSDHPANVLLRPYEMSFALPGTQVAVELLFRV